MQKAKITLKTRLKMYHLCFVLILSISGVFGKIEDFDDWQYDTGRPSVNNQGGDSKCKKDILLIVDTSLSVGEGDFDDNVKPFLKNLVTDQRLNVGPDGTQIGLIMFASDKKTEVKLTMGKIKNAELLGKYMENLKWDDVKGDRTRTELALNKAKGIFSRKSPKNHRPSIADVIILVTDGEPRGKTNTPKLTKQYAQDLKNNDVLFIAAGVGSQSKQPKFVKILKELATSDDYFFQADFDHMDDILGALVAKSCIKPGQCSCEPNISGDLKVPLGQSKAVARWPKPKFSCGSGDPIVESETVDPDIRSPHAFSPGKHVINYTYNLRGDVTVTCPITITVRGQLCRGKAFDTGREECCCGRRHVKKSGHECCGREYINLSAKKCCAHFNVVDLTDRCPNY